MTAANMELDIWRGDWGLASIDLECLRALTYMKFIGVPVRVRETNNPFWTPRGTLPVLRDGRFTFDTFHDIIQHLKSLHFSTDVHLDSMQESEGSAFTQYLREKLYPAVQYACWADDKNYSEMSRPAYAKAMRIPFNFYYPPKYHAQAKDMVDALYGDNCDLKDVERTIYNEAEMCLKTLSDRLGESEYFFGSRPSSFDATVYAYLAPLVKAPFSNTTLQSQVRGINNLSRFVTRISQKYFRKVTADYATKQSKNTHSSGTQADRDSTMPNETRNKVLAVLFAGVAMTGYAIATGLYQVNFRDEFSQSREYNDLFENEEDDN